MKMREGGAGWSCQADLVLPAQQSEGFRWRTGVRTTHLAVQVQGLPHQRQSDEFLGALAPGPQEEVGQGSVPLGFLRSRQIALSDHLGQLSVERGYELVGLEDQLSLEVATGLPGGSSQMQVHPKPSSDAKR